MKIKFPYGVRSVLKLETAADAEVFMPRSGRKSVPVAEFTRMMARRLAAPLGYPPLGACLMPEDRVVIPLAAGVPEVERVLAGILEYLFSGADAEVFRGMVTVLRPAEPLTRQPVTDEKFLDAVLRKISSTPKDVREHVRILTHAPDRKDVHALLGAAENDESLVVSRELFDADFILPVCVALPPETPDYAGVYSAVYPLFADEKTQKRFTGLTLSPREKRLRATAREGLSPAEFQAAERAMKHQETQEVARQLGLSLAVMVLPNIPRRQKEGTKIADVMVGLHGPLNRLADIRYRKIWRAPQRLYARMVLASITGGPQQQTWENAATALEHAARCVDEDEDGTIVLVSEIAASPGPALRTYALTHDPEMSLQMIRAAAFPDSRLARRMIPLLHRYHVVFISPLDEETLHELNISPMEKISELRQMVAHSDSCVFLPDAHRLTKPARKRPTR